MGRARSAYSRQVEAEQALHDSYVRNKVRRIADDEVPRKVEANYRAAHERAAKHRRKAAMQVDEMRRQHGDVLGWQAQIDSKTTPECLAAHGSNFRVSNPPAIGYPGTVHAECRCRATAPWTGAAVMGSYGERQSPSNMNDFLRRAVASARRNVQRFFGRSN